MTGQLQLSFVTYKKDSFIIVEGKQDSDRFFIIHEGKVRISKEVEVVAEEGGNILGPGDFFAVVSTMSAHRHIETAQAITDCVLITVHKEQYGDLIQNNTPLAMKIILHFSKRLRFLDEALSRITLKNIANPDPSHLFDIAEYYVRQSRYNQAYYAFYKYIKYCPQGEHVAYAKDRMIKIGIYVEEVQIEFGAEEVNRVYPKNSMLFAEGEPGEELFIIQKGSVTIAKIADNNEVLLALLKEGDIFGEMALLEAKPRVANAVAYEECQVVTVNRANFQQMIKNQPQLIAKFTTLLAERIWFIYKQLANTLIRDPLGRMYDALHIQLEKNRVPLNSNSSYTFDFGPKELVHMVGLPQKEANQLLRKILDSKIVSITKDKIHTVSVQEIIRQTESYRKMQKIGNVRR